MPIYEYLCPKSHVTEQLVASTGHSETYHCPLCGEEATKMVSVPNVRYSWIRPVLTAKDAWEGTPLHGTDGKNELYYKSNKIQIDMGRSGSG